MTETVEESILFDLSEYHSQQAEGQGLTSTYVINLSKEREIIAKHTDQLEADYKREVENHRLTRGDYHREIEKLNEKIATLREALKKIKAIQEDRIWLAHKIADDALEATKGDE